MKIFLILFLLVLLAVNGYGQITDGVIMRYGNIYTLEPEEIKEIDIFSLKSDSKYFGDRWFKAVLTLNSSKELNLDASRYDFANKTIEIFIENTIYSLENEHVVGFELIEQSGLNHHFRKIVSDEGTSEFGEVLVDGEYPLYKEYFVKIKKSNYVPALDIGSKKDQKILSPKYYFQNGEEVFLIPNNKKKAEKLITREIGKEFISKNKIDLKKEEGLIHLFLMINKKISKNEND